MFINVYNYIFNEKMVIKNYNVSLDEEVVEQVKKIFEEKGQKLSPVINQYLIKLIEDDK